MQQGGSQPEAPLPEMPSPVSSRALPSPERSTLTGNRWPQEETLVMLKIRSEMDTEFREATLKGPMWEEVSRRLAEQGYTRSGKKCREKFENVQKYYKRTKGNQAGRPDGKSYRFFTQLEALHSTTQLGIGTAAPAVHQPTPLSSLPPPARDTPLPFSTVVPSSTSDSEETDDGVRKRKRRGRIQRMMSSFEDMMRKVMDRQESMQQRFLEALENRDAVRTTREEEWRRQEEVRLARESEAAVQERAASAARDAAIMALLQKLSRQVNPTATPPNPAWETRLMTSRDLQQSEHVEVPPQGGEDGRRREASLQVAGVQESEVEVVPLSEPSSSRWPKSEVHALIEIRTSIDSRYQQVGPKGPLWEEISAAMAHLGYNRNPKRCKEKWENINKYFKRVKESSKRRPEDAKTCPYFHQLDAHYRSKSLGNNTFIPQDVPPPSTEQLSSDGSEREVNQLGGNGERPKNAGGQEENPPLEKPEDILMELMDGWQNGIHQLSTTRAIAGKDRNTIDGDGEEDLTDAGEQNMPYQLEPKRLKLATTQGCSKFLAMTL